MFFSSPSPKGLFLKCELSVDSMANRLSMYSSFSTNLGWTRQRDPTVPVVYTTEYMCVNVRLHSHGTAQRRADIWLMSEEH